MSIAIISASGRTGPGYSIRVQWTGAAPEDFIEIFDTSNLVGGSIQAGTATAAFVKLGVFAQPPPLLGTGPASGKDGDAMSLSAVHLRPTGGAVQTSAAVAFTYDPVGGLANLLDNIYQLVRLSPSHEELDAILAAVTKTFPSLVG